MMSPDIYTALNRFGLGGAPGEAEKIGSYPEAWLKRQIRRGLPTPEPLRHYPSTARILGDIHRVDKNGSLKSQTIADYGRTFTYEMIDRANLHLTTELPFYERMVMFWSNHFTTARKGSLYPALAAFEREAIRPQTFGKFEQMLIDVIRHPVMLLYLDNDSSIGPNSPHGLKYGGRINENLAREILELHTLGVDGGYTQTDVIEFARALTGWTLNADHPKADKKTGFYFDESLHEPGWKTVCGRRFRGTGYTEAISILRHLRRLPATAKHIATKLARHFVSDDPPASAVERLEKVFKQTHGDLAAVSRTLFSMNEIWDTPLAKVKTPYEYFISIMRAMGQTEVKPQNLMRPMEAMQNMPFDAPSPAGWPDIASYWIGPGSLMRRLEWVHAQSRYWVADNAPLETMDMTIGPVADEMTRHVIMEAPTPTDGLALVFASREFQRR